MKKKVSIVLIAGVLMLAMVNLIILIKNARQVEGATTLSNRLRLINRAKHQWALVNNKNTNDVPTWADISPYIPEPSLVFSNFSYTNGEFVGPTREAYTIGRMDESPTCRWENSQRK